MHLFPSENREINLTNHAMIRPILGLEKTVPTQRRLKYCVALRNKMHPEVNV